MSYSNPLSKMQFWQLVVASLFALKILIFSAGYPLFNTTDEFPNFDTAIKHGRGYSYYDTTYTYDTLTLKIAHEVQSKNYLLGKYQNPDYIPLLSLQYNTKWEDYLNIFSKIKHQQAHSSPFYYATYGMIFYLLPDSWSSYAKVYTLRFLNSILAFLLAWFSMQVLQLVFVHELVGLAGGILLIGVPQSIYYFINIDILSALSAVWCFYAALQFTLKSNWLWAILLGVASAFAILVKASALVAVSTSFLLVLLYLKPTTLTKLKLIGLSVFSCLALLIPSFIYRTHAGVGLFATKSKIEVLTWKEKAIGDYFPHVLSSLGGLREYFSQTWKTWWIGESLWNGAPIYDDSWKVYFAIVMAIFLIAFLLITILNRREHSIRQMMRYTSLLCVFGYFLLFAYLSVKYDFGDCVYPSKYFPVFVSGRLLLGMLIPFLFILTDTIATLFKKTSWVVLVVALTIGVVHLTIEIVEVNAVFSDSKNYYHQVLGL